MQEHCSVLKDPCQIQQGFVLQNNKIIIVIIEFFYLPIHVSSNDAPSKNIDNIKVGK